MQDATQTQVGTPPAATNGKGSGGFDVAKLAKIAADKAQARSAETSATKSNGKPAGEAAGADASVVDKPAADANGAPEKKDAKADAKVDPKKTEDEKAAAAAKDKPKTTDDLDAEWAKVRRVEKENKNQKAAIAASEAKVKERETAAEAREKAAAAKEAEAAEIIRLAKEEPHKFAEKAGVPVRRLVESVIEHKKKESEEEAKLTPEQRELRAIKAELDERKAREAKQAEEAAKAKADEDEARALQEAEEAGKKQSAARKGLEADAQKAFEATLSEDTLYPTLHEHYEPALVARAAVELRIEHYKSLGSPDPGEYDPLSDEEVFETLEKRAVRAQDERKSAVVDADANDYAGRRAQFLASRGRTTAGGGQGRDPGSRATDGAENERGASDGDGSEPITNAHASQRSSVGSRSLVGNRSAAKDALRKALRG